MNRRLGDIFVKKNRHIYLINRRKNKNKKVATLVDGDTVILTYQPSPVHRANAATLHATWRAPVKISLWPVGYLPAEISGLSPYMIMQAMSSCEMCCELPYILKKKCFTEMEEAPRSRKIVARLDSFFSFFLS